MTEPHDDISPDSARLSVSLTMIVRNEEANLSACLESVRDLFDEIIVVDTGSTDKTIEIARSFGAKVVSFDWVDDFAAARNVTIEHASGDYLFWLDADETLDKENRDRLRTLLAGLRRKEAIYIMRQSSDLGGPSGSALLVEQVRLFPSGPKARWTGRLHEQILPAYWGSAKIHWTDVVITHNGFSDPKVVDRKTDRDLRIVLAEVEAEPDSVSARRNLSRFFASRGDGEAALEQIHACLSLLPPQHPGRFELYAISVQAHLAIENLEAAHALCQEALGQQPDDAEILSFQGSILYKMKDYDGAAASWRRILGLQRPQRFLKLTTGFYSHETRRNLAALAVERGNYREAFQLYTEIIAECPRDKTAVAYRSWIARKLLASWFVSPVSAVAGLFRLARPTPS